MMNGWNFDGRRLVLSKLIFGFCELDYVFYIHQQFFLRASGYTVDFVAGKGNSVC